MRLLAYSFFIPFVLGEKLVIDTVDSAVAQQLAKFKAYVNYQGVTDAELAPSPTNATHKAAPKVEVDGGALGPKKKLGAVTTPYWYEIITHQGKAAFNTNTTYAVFRNVMTYGAKGDGVTDDTAAIQLAISDGNRCAPGSSCPSSTTYPAVVYFPAGTYIISSSLIDYYNTQLLGNPNSVPTLKATRGFTGFGVIDGDRYTSTGTLGFQANNIFYRQVRNFIIDITSIPATSPATGIHWPTGQATSLQNIVFNMSMNSGTKHQGLFIEAGSGGFMNDLIFYGGLNGAVFGNQQFTARNLTFYNAITAINQIWNWSWTYKSITVVNCSVGLDMTNGNANPETVSSVTLLDSSFTNTTVAIKTNRQQGLTKAPNANSLAVENVLLKNVSVAVQLGTTKATVLNGSIPTAYLGLPSQGFAGFGSGNLYNPAGPVVYTNPFQTFARAPSLISASGNYYERSKPQYSNLSVSQFSSVKAGGAVGDGVTDDTYAVQTVINTAAAASNVVFFDAGTYKVNRTIFIPGGSKIVGESYSVIMSSGIFFSASTATAAVPVVQVGNAGDTGIVEWSDMIVSTQGPQPGAILIQWNLVSTAASPSGMWDVHTRIGGFSGSNLQKATCAQTSGTAVTSSAGINSACVTAFMNMWITSGAAGLYMENVWLWTADHDIDDTGLAQLTLYTGRGLLIQNTTGPIWLVASAVEHHQRYQYQLLNAKNIYMGMIKSESAYYQPNPTAALPYVLNSTFSDPSYSTATGQGNYCDNTFVGTINGTCTVALALRMISSTNVSIYGAGLYTYYNNYNPACLSTSATTTCNNMAFAYDADVSSHVTLYGLNTVGAWRMAFGNASTLATDIYNLGVYPSTIFYYRAFNLNG